MTVTRRPPPDDDLAALLALAASDEDTTWLRDALRRLFAEELRLPTEDDEAYDFLEQPS